MAKVPLSKQSTKICGFVSFKNPPSDVRKIMNDLVESFLKVDCEKYGMCLHDKDLNSDGDCTHIHFHFVFQLKKRKRLTTVISLISKVCGVSTMDVFIDEYVSFEGYFQYLIHKTNPEKYQYSVSDIITDFDTDEIDLILNAKTKSVSLKEIADFIQTGARLYDIIDFCGMSLYQHYRSTIHDLIREFEQTKSKESELQRQNDYLQHELNNIYTAINDLMITKSALLNGSVPLKDLQVIIDDVTNISTKARAFDVHKGKNPW